MKRYYGKYRGKVRTNLDPLGLARLLVNVPDFPGLETIWAMPCVPYAGPRVGFYMIPPEGAGVWVEFEGGNLNSPIWSGCFWDEGQVPGADPEALPTKKIIQTASHSITLDDLDGVGGLTIQVGPPAVEVPMSVTCNAQGIAIKLGPQISITMQEQQVAITIPPARLTLTEEAITASLPEATATMTPESISAGVPPANFVIAAEAILQSVEPGSVSVSAEGVNLVAAAANVDVTEAVIELSNDAANVTITPAAVVVNDGALMVI